MDETYMIGIGIFMILILTLVYEPPIREGLDIGKEIRKSFEKPIKDVKKSTEKEFNKAKNATNKEFNKAKDATNKEFNKAKKETTKEFNKAKKETTKGFNVVKKGAEKAAKEASKAFDDIFAEIQNIINYIVCAFDKIKSLPDCFFWYFLDMVYGIFYLFYSMLAFAVPPLKDVGKMTWKGVKGADELIYDLMGFHIIGYPKDVMNKCYLCKPQRKKKRR
jgi:F0F1-type ATP synthase membrane subunit b/b'